MPITGVSTDYSTRKKDLHIFQGVDPNKPARIDPAFGRISNYCAGVQKLVQRYAISLLTEIGSQENYPDFGTDLISSLINSSNLINKADVTHIFNFANMKVITTFRDYQRENADMPEDEQIDTAVLNDIVVANNMISLLIQIYPVSGSTTQFLLPLPNTK